jgi:hypothetical protein
MDIIDRQPIATAPRDGTQILLWCAGTHCDVAGYKLGRFVTLGRLISLVVNGVIYADFARSFPFWWELPPEQPDRDHRGDVNGAEARASP